MSRPLLFLFSRNLAWLCSLCFLISLFAPSAKGYASFRSKSLDVFDNSLDFFLSQKGRSYEPSDPLEQTVFVNHAPAILSFDAEYGYFSSTHPIVGRVTENEADIYPITALLKTIYEEKEIDVRQGRLMTAEVLAKALAYRSLKEGMEIAIPFYFLGTKNLVSYVVHTLFDLWHGMPAFGLVPKEEGDAPALLLFRGTDLSFTSVQGWASVVSDLDLTGPGHKVFLSAQPSIHRWLADLRAQGKKTQAIGFSLGGILAAYTAFYEKDFLSDGAIAFNPPGFSKASLPEKISLITCVTQGDKIPKIGFLAGELYALSLEKPLKPWRAHVSLVTTAPIFYETKIGK